MPSAWRIINNRWVVLSARLLLGGILIAAGIMKLLDIGQFVRLVELSYGTLPEGLARLIGPEGFLNLVGVVLPGVELVCGVLILLGVFLRPAAYVSFAMSALFVAVNAMDLAAGQRSCPGCFGEAVSIPVGLAIAIDSGMLMLCLAIVLSRVKGTTLGGWLGTLRQQR